MSLLPVALARIAALANKARGLLWSDGTSIPLGAPPTSGQVLVRSGAEITGQALSSALGSVAAGGDLGGTMDAPTVTDLTLASEARGDLVRRGALSWSRLALGTAGQVLRSDGTDPQWAAYPWRYEVVSTTAYYPGAIAYGGTLGTGGAVAQDMYKARPWIAPRTGTIDRLAIDVTTSKAASNTVIAIWSDSGGAPGTVLGEGAVSSASTGLKTTTVSVSVVAGTTYWFTYLSSTDTVVVRTPQASQMAPVGGFALGGTAPSVTLQVAQAYASPTPAWPGGATWTDTASSFPVVFYRWSA